VIESSTNSESGVGNRESGLGPNSERVRLLPSPPAPLPQGERGELSVKRAEAPVVGQASHARIAANRRNAAQSTGPRTLGGKRRVALNAVKHGRYASTDAWTAKTMLKLGEDPEAWRRRRQELLSDWQPRGVAETMLVEDLANLYWEKAWLRRAKAAHQFQKAESKALEREREALRAGSEPFDLERAASIGGLRRAREDDPDKFSIALELLDELADRARRRAWHEDSAEAFRLLYDWHPTRLGVQIMALFESRPQSEAPAGETSAEEEALRRLEGLIAEESQLVIEERELYERRQAASSGPADDTLLAPLSYWWAEVERQEAALDRQIERKIRLLVELERKRRGPARSRKQRRRPHHAAGLASLAAERASAVGRKKGAKRGKIQAKQSHYLA